MKYNKWTVALAALGVVSLASAAKAEEKASPVTTALASTTISGYVDTSAQWNFKSGDANLPPYKFNGPAKADGFNLDVIQLRIDKPLDEADWAAGYRADLWFGPDANALGTRSIWSNGGSSASASQGDFAVRQAYVALRTPVGTGLDFKMGVFDSIIGYESVESGNNPNYTRSYGHSIEPQTMTGLLASYRFCECLSASGGIADTMGPRINDRAFAPSAAGATHYAESYKTYMGSVALTAPDSMGFLKGSTLYAGIVGGFLDTATHGGENSAQSYYAGATIATPIKDLRAGAAFDLLAIDNADNNDYAISGYLSYQASEKLSFHGRAEYLKDKVGNPAAGQGGSLLFNPGVVPVGQKAEVFAVTLTAQYDLWKNVISRVEFRWDHSLLGNDLFGGSTTGLADSVNAFMLAANVIYKF
jgi:hypothetical protein